MRRLPHLAFDADRHRGEAEDAFVGPRGMRDDARGRVADAPR